MNKICRTIATLIMLFSSVSSYGSLMPLDFEDLGLGNTYVPGDMFVSSSHLITASDFQWSGGTWTSGGVATVDNAGMAGGSGQEMNLNNINLNLYNGGIIDRIELQFGEYGGNLNIEINGSFYNFENFADINGMLFGANSIGVINGLGNDSGTLSITGGITSFSLGGQELWIDNVHYYVPVPAAMWLFVSGLIGLIGVTGVKRHG